VIKRLASLVALGLLAVACGDPGTTTVASPAATESPKTLTLDESDNGKKLTLAMGGVVKLTLETTPGTGYEWTYSEKPDPKVLKQTADTTKASEQTGSEPIVGAPVMRTWTYEAIGAGSSSVKLGYVPPGGGAPDETFSFSVMVT
jgi:predicted secreted protein